MSAHDDLALIREKVLHHLEGSFAADGIEWGTHAEDCPGCAIEPALGRVEAELARLISDKALLKDEGDMLLRNVRAAQKRAEAAEAEVARLREEHEGARIVAEAQVSAQSAQLARLQDGLRRIVELDTQRVQFAAPGGVAGQMRKIARALLGSTEDTPALDEADLKIERWGRADHPQMDGVVRNPRGVRITHIPTGLTAECDEEKSQLRNREIALRLLTAAVLGSTEDTA